MSADDAGVVRVNTTPLQGIESVHSVTGEKLDLSIEIELLRYACDEIKLRFEGETSEVERRVRLSFKKDAAQTSRKFKGRRDRRLADVTGSCAPRHHDFPRHSPARTRRLRFDAARNAPFANARQRS